VAIKFEKIKAGDVLYDVHSYRMGNTTLRSLGCWEVRVISVDPQLRNAVVSWNSNRPETWSERRLKKLCAKEPVLVKNSTGQERRPPRGEVPPA
jgi:hypothetical protein